jgi:hypothetical protein
VKSARNKSKVDLSWLRSWFDLAPDERKFMAGILAIALVGLVARYVHMKNQKPEPVAPQGVEQAEHAGEL